MLAKSDLDFLRSFRSAGHPAVSLYLNTDGKQNSRKEIETMLKEMSRTARQQVEQGPGSKHYKREAGQEIQRVGDYLEGEFRTFNTKGMVIFSCSGADFWREYPLARSPRNRFMIGENLFLRPLQLMEGERHRTCLVLADRNHARIFLIADGAILEYRQLLGATPHKARSAGWAGYDETKTAHRIEQKLGEHFHQVAQTVFELLKHNPFDWLILGGKTEYTHDLRSSLHPYLRERIIGILDVPADLPEHEVLEKALNTENGMIFKEQCKIVEHLHQVCSRSGGEAVAGLEDTLRSLNARAVDTLLVLQEYQAQGVRCLSCGFLGVLEQLCPHCGSPLLELDDVVTPAIDQALEMGCHVRQIFEGVGMDRLGNLGAWLRFKV